MIIIMIIRVIKRIRNHKLINYIYINTAAPGRRCKLIMISTPTESDSARTRPGLGPGVPQWPPGPGTAGDPRPCNSHGDRDLHLNSLAARGQAKVGTWELIRQLRFTPPPRPPLARFGRDVY